MLTDVFAGCFKKDEVSVCTSSQASADKWRVGCPYEISLKLTQNFRPKATPTPTPSRSSTMWPSRKVTRVFLSLNMRVHLGIIMLGVKPQMLQTVLGEIRQVSWFSGDAYKRDNCRIFSILAGLELHALYAQVRRTCEAHAHSWIISVTGCFRLTHPNHSRLTSSPGPMSRFTVTPGA